MQMPSSSRSSVPATPRPCTVEPTSQRRIVAASAISLVIPPVCFSRAMRLPSVADSESVDVTVIDADADRRRHETEDSSVRRHRHVLRGPRSAAGSGGVRLGLHDRRDVSAPAKPMGHELEDEVEDVILTAIEKGVLAAVLAGGETWRSFKSAAEHRLGLPWSQIKAKLDARYHARS